jgi:hypothetical protein
MTSIARVNADDLVEWARRRDAQDGLPHLIRQLVQATTNTATRLEFRSGAGVHLSGWDGITVLDEDHPYAPRGPAGWEMGVQAGPRQKADRDYAARLEDSGDLAPAASAFVFVTLRRWRDRDRWVREKSTERRFREVRALDADDLHAWLDTAPGVHLLLSERLGKPVEDAEPLAEAWRRWSTATQYPVLPSLVLAGREDQVEQLRERLTSSPTVTTIQADSPDEALAFIASTLYDLADDRRDAILTRSVVARSAQATTILRHSASPLLLVAPGIAPGEAAAAVQAGHQVLVPVGPEQPRRADMIVLGRLRREPAKAALVSMGVPESDADEYATLARRSLGALRRLLAAGPIDVPAWALPQHVPGLVAALLAGSWTDALDGDQDALSALADGPYEDFERLLHALAAQSDPPVRRTGNHWLLVSREDAWSLLSQYVTDADLRRFDVVASTVLGAPDPALELAPEERWLAQLHGRARPHSGELREGIAETLAQLAGQGDRLRLVSSLRGQEIANGIVHRLLTRANEETNGHLWMSTADVLPLLAEAAPEAFLRAVDAGTSGDHPLLATLYQDAEQRGFPFGSSAHTGLLWALETLAWSSAYLGRAALFLARLARLDPGGKLANRPSASLREIFLPWHPQTAAPVEDRLGVLDALRRAEPAIAWNLMIALLPQTSDIGHNNSSPRWRDWKPPESRTVNVAEWTEFTDQLMTRLIDDAHGDAERWGELIREADTVPRSTWSRLADALERLDPEGFSDVEREAMRRGIRHVVALHRTASQEAQWALPEGELRRLDDVYGRLVPEDVIVAHRWLFDHDPQLPRGEDRDWKRHRERIDERRSDAVREILAAAGIDSLTELASTVQDPIGLGWATGMAEGSEQFASFLDLLVSEQPGVAQFATGYAAALINRLEEPWMREVYAAGSTTWSPAQRGAFLATAKPGEDIWAIAEADDATAHEYWTRVNEYRVDEHDFLRAAGSLLQHGRPVAAAELLAHRPAAVAAPEAADLALDALEQAALVPVADSNDRAMRPYYVSKILGRLDEIDGVDPNRIARIEWLYLPLLDRSDRRPRLLQATLASDPAFFVEVLSWIYRAKDEEPSESPREEDAHRARLAWELLHGWHIPPGADDDGAITDPAALTEWISHVRALAAERERLEVADSQIGQVLAYAAPDADGAWPPRAVRDIIEALASEALERGIQTATFNRRGVTTRSLTAGGTQERELARQYRNHAEGVMQWPRTAATLLAIAESFEEMADREDREAEHTEDTWR